MIGRQVVKLLREKGFYVTTVSLDDPLFNVSNLHYKGDLTNPDFTRKLINEYDYVFHLAGLKGSPGDTKDKPASYMMPILKMNLNVLEACMMPHVKGVVYTSSVGAYQYRPIMWEAYAHDGEPMDWGAGWAKRMGEYQIMAYEREFKTDKFAIVRMTNTYGPGDNFDPDKSMFIPSLIAKLRRGDKVINVQTDGYEVRDFLYSGDAARGILLAMEHGLGQGVINLGGTICYTIREVISIMQEIVPFECHFEDKQAQHPRRILGTKKAREVLGYHPTTTLQEGLRETWYVS